MLTTGAELWTHWLDLGVLRPAGYDRDLADLVQRAVGEVPGSDIRTVPTAMEHAGWGARDLLRTLHPALLSFSGMLRELLQLYSRIDATRTGQENLRIHYEFEDGDQLDDQLEAFRERVNRIERSIRSMQVFTFSMDFAWNSPFAHRADALGADWREHVGSLLSVPSEGLRSWPFAGKFRTPVVDAPRLARVISEHRQVIVAALHELEQFGENLDEMPILPAESQIRTIYFASTDFWAPQQISLMNLAPQLLEGLSSAESEDLIGVQSQWLAKFWDEEDVSIEQCVEEVTDILSLPQWGRRHELYSAWLAAAMDKALESRLQFEVTDGVLSFPFRPTLLATLATASGEVELWAERRFAAKPPLAHGRKAGIQPDYAFLEGESVLAAVEAKHYAHPSARKHGETARDYARNLRHAQIFMVAHGPLGASAMHYVAEADRPRVQLHEQVRPGQGAARTKFASALRSLFPLPAHIAQSCGRQGSGEAILTWSPLVQDLDLHVIHETSGGEVCWGNTSSAYAALQADAFDGGPERVILRPCTSPIRVEVRLFAGTVRSVADADPQVLLEVPGFRGDLRPAQGAVTGRTWHVATIEACGCVRLGDSTVPVFAALT
ncbi:MAG: hypothetical protein WAV45_06405 [Propionibacteriaceae bacterium]|nr:hypothetical protein [Micropruina sp.]HBX82087.1 hypothetical protein [Propionibacteriaceae bacterium]HBY24875.1 hypothetical protein [Propionibacteriaceae bacterium]